MKTEKIKPIPKYISERIRKADKANSPFPSSNTRFYSYLTKNDGELVKVTVAVRHKRKQLYLKQCAIHGLHSEFCFIKDIGFTFLGGYKVGWYYDGLTSYPKWYEDNTWRYADDKYFRVYAPCVNLDYIGKFDKYKYSAWTLTNQEILLYLRLYEQFPQVEYLIKAGLHNISTSKPILRRIAADKKFCKWLIVNKEKLQKNFYYKDVVLRAYRCNRDLDELQKEKSFQLTLNHDENYKYLTQTYDKQTVSHMKKYVLKQNISFATYRDYIRACEYLNLDLTQEKNLFPHNFTRWHTIRSEEYQSAKSMQDERERKELYKRFALVSEKYLSLQHKGKSRWIAIIAKSPAELIAEGDTLHHCVGRMGYDRKFIREESLIFFIRSKAHPEVPFVTVEYSLKTHTILQLHGDHNTAPDEETTHYIKKVWLPYANKHLKQISA